MRNGLSRFHAPLKSHDSYTLRAIPERVERIMVSAWHFRKDFSVDDAIFDPGLDSRICHYRNLSILSYGWSYVSSKLLISVSELFLNSCNDYLSESCPRYLIGGLSEMLRTLVNKKRTTVRQTKEEILYFDKKIFNVLHEFTSLYSCIPIFTKHFFREKRTNRTASAKIFKSSNNFMHSVYFCIFKISHKCKNIFGLIIAVPRYPLFVLSIGANDSLRTI